MVIADEVLTSKSSLKFGCSIRFEPQTTFKRSAPIKRELDRSNYRFMLIALGYIGGTPVSALLSIIIFVLAVAVSPATSAELQADEPETIWISSWQQNEIFGFVIYKSGMLKPTGVILTEGIHRPLNVVFDKDGDLWVVNSNNSIVEFNKRVLADADAAPTFIYSVHLSNPVDIAFDLQGHLWAANWNNTITEYTVEPAHSSLEALSSIIRGVNRPEAIVFDRWGNLWVANNWPGDVVMYSRNSLQHLDGSTQPSATLKSDLGFCTAMRIDQLGNLWVANGDSTISEFSRLAFDQSKVGELVRATVRAGRFSYMGNNGEVDGGGFQSIAFDKYGHLITADFPYDNVQVYDVSSIVRNPYEAHKVLWKVNVLSPTGIAIYRTQ